MKILAIDTTTEACSAAIFNDGQVIEKYEVCPRGHTKQILGIVDEVLKEANLTFSQLDGVAYGQGPGSFTGVRLCVSVAQGLGFAHNLPLVPISSLAAMALSTLKQCSGVDTVITALDARMNQIYLGAFKVADKTIVPVMDEVLQDLDKPMPLLGENVVACGHGFSSYPSLVSEQYLEVFADVLPHAGEIAVLAAPIFAAGLGQQASACSATYLRNDVVQSA